MLDTLHAYGSRLPTQAEEHDAAAALAAWAVEFAEQASTELRTNTAKEQEAARWLDAENPAMRQALAWAIDHDPATAAQLAAALAWWWWLSLTADYCGDNAASVEHCTVVCDMTEGRGPSPVLAGALGDRAISLTTLGRLGEATEDARRALAMAREIGNPTAQLYALAALSGATRSSGDLDGGPTGPAGRAGYHRRTRRACPVVQPTVAACQQLPGAVALRVRAGYERSS